LKRCAAAQAPAPEPFPGCSLLPIAPPEAAVGVDVGEDYLDLAILRTNTLEHHRVALAGIEDDPLGILRLRLTACCPDTNRRWVALIDSPRWPVDLDCSSRAAIRRDPAPAGRILDSALRAMLRRPAACGAIRLSMFPTPKLVYFQNCAAMPACKPHLRAIFHQLFESGAAVPASAGASARAGGGNFTRFMLAGFLTFRAWQELGVQTLEAYPDLQFRLASRRLLIPKRMGRPALAARTAVIKRLRRSLGIPLKKMPETADQADAEILALSAAQAARKGFLAALQHPAEGRFLITFQLTAG
jgi:hypothetical protein